MKLQIGDIIYTFIQGINPEYCYKECHVVCYNWGRIHRGDYGDTVHNLRHFMSQIFNEEK